MKWESAPSALQVEFSWMAGAGFSLLLAGFVGIVIVAALLASWLK